IPLVGRSLRCWLGLRGPPVPSELHDAVRGEGSADADCGPEADPIDVRCHAEARNALQVLIKGRHLVPEVGLGAADAGMTTANWPIGAFVPAYARTVLERHRTLTAHLVQAVSVAVAGIAPGLDVLPGIELRPAFAVGVDRLAICEQRAPVAIERRPRLESQVIDDQRRQVVRVRRTGREVDQILEVGNRVRAPKGGGGVWGPRRR